MPRDQSPAGPVTLLALGLGLGRCASPAQEPQMPGTSTFPASSVEAPQVAPATPSALVDLSATLLGQVVSTGVRFVDLATGSVASRHEIPRASAITALPDGRWVALADGGGRTVVLFDEKGAETERFTVPEAPAATRLLPEADGFWIATAKGTVRYPLKAALAGVHVSDARVEEAPPAPISLTRLADGSLVSVSGGQLVRQRGEGAATLSPLPEGLSTPVRLAAGAGDALWLAPWTGPLRHVELTPTLLERGRIETTGVVYAVAAAGERVAWLEVLERAPAGPGQWTLQVAEATGTRLLRLDLPDSGRRAFEDASDRGLCLSPDGATVAVGGRSALGVWRVADGAAIVLLGSGAEQPL